VLDGLRPQEHNDVPQEAAMANEPNKPTSPNDATQHVTTARERLIALRRELKDHPDLERAIEDLELALSALSMKTGGLL
jgi:hypothetical protein